MFIEIFQVVVVGMLIAVPVDVIYKKAGFNPAWAALVFVPGFGLFWVFLHLALRSWPNARDDRC